jgi:dienelactone hydrolase
MIRLDHRRHDAPELAEPGPHRLGVQTLTVTVPDSLDVAALDPQAAQPPTLPRRDRVLAVEVWYPAVPGSPPDPTTPPNLRAQLRDGRTEVDLGSLAVRNATPDRANGPFPLVLVSHGFPGNRFLLAPLAEHLATHGHVVAAIDHVDTTYDTLSPRGLASALVHRPLDQRAVLDAFENLGTDPNHPLHGLADAGCCALIGYSMGGYGVLVAAGAGVTAAAVSSTDFPLAVPHGLLAVHQASVPPTTADPRIRAVIAIAPWGSVRGVFDTQSLAGLRAPLLLVAGSEDEISGYETGVRATWRDARCCERALLTFELAGHNVGALLPCPDEIDHRDPETGINHAQHYRDAVWDAARMNNVSQHAATAWLRRHLRGDTTAASFLQPSHGANGQALANAWQGFPAGTTRGLRLELLQAG